MSNISIVSESIPSISYLKDILDNDYVIDLECWKQKQYSNNKKDKSLCKETESFFSKFSKNEQFHTIHIVSEAPEHQDLLTNELDFVYLIPLKTNGNHVFFVENEEVILEENKVYRFNQKLNHGLYSDIENEEELEDAILLNVAFYK